MGRKKRKTNDDEAAEDDGDAGDAGGDAVDASSAMMASDGNAVAKPTSALQAPEPPAAASSSSAPLVPAPASSSSAAAANASAAAASSGYAMTSHSGEIVHEDIYVSDGSESEDCGDDDNDDEENKEGGENAEGEENAGIASGKPKNRRITIVLVNSRNGIMRRGIGGAAGFNAANLLRPNRQWVRGGGADGTTGAATGGEQVPGDAESGAAPAGGGGVTGTSLAETLANMDPAQRAARLLQEKQRKQELEKILARQREAEENAGKDPNLFSKRTAFDIRFDQIEDKPWLRGSGELSDFFNYDLQEEDWLEYGQQQLMIRQELVDAARNKRPVDPNIVPVVPKTSPAALAASQAPHVPVSASAGVTAGNPDGSESAAMDVEGPTLPSAADAPPESDAAVPVDSPDKSEPAKEGKDDPDKARYADLKVVGGAWGGLAGSKLARLIEEQEKQSAAVGAAVAALDAAMGGGGKAASQRKDADGPDDDYDMDDEDNGRARGRADDADEYGDEDRGRGWDRDEDRGNSYRRDYGDDRRGGRSHDDGRESTTSSRHKRESSRNAEDATVDDDDSSRHRRSSAGGGASGSRRHDDRRNRYDDSDDPRVPHPERDSKDRRRYDDAAQESYHRYRDPHAYDEVGNTPGAYYRPEEDPRAWPPYRDDQNFGPRGGDYYGGRGDTYDGRKGRDWNDRVDGRYDAYGPPQDYKGDYRGGPPADRRTDSGHRPPLEPPQAPPPPPPPPPESSTSSGGRGGRGGKRKRRRR